jgi:hypothetical protein
MGIPAKVKWKHLKMQSPVSTTVGKTSRSIFWTLFGAIQSAGAAVLAMSQALTSTTQKCLAGMEKIAKDMNNPASVKKQNVGPKKEDA